jgi:polyhydroxyalkanoate synthesis regulator phasin
VSKIEKIKRQIKEIETRLEKSNFRGIIDQQTIRRDEDRLKKLRKELEKLEKEG